MIKPDGTGRIESKEALIRCQFSALAESADSRAEQAHQHSNSSYLVMYLPSTECPSTKHLYTYGNKRTFDDGKTYQRIE